MADNGGQPTILVKKADGTFERKTLDQVNALKKPAATSAAPAPVTPKPAPKIVSKEALQALNNAINEDKAATKAASKASKVEPIGQPIITPAKDAQADGIIAGLSFAVSSTGINRLRTLIQLRFKDIRTPDQVHEALLRSEEEGGVGLTDAQAEEIVKQLPGWLPAPAKQVAPSAVAKPAVPVAAPVVSKTVTPPSPEAKEKAISTFIKNTPEEPYFSTKAFSPKIDKPLVDTGRPVMRDITTTQPMAMGPIDEIRSFSLTDFRRLSNNPEEAAMRLKQKFVNLKDESVLLYMDSLDAWKKSPLHAEYVLSAISSLATKQPLGSGKDSKAITLPEIKAIVGMEHQLVYV